MIHISAVPADAALPALAEAIAAAKRGAALAPVTVIVPTNAAGVTARRWLGRHGGIAAIDVVTLARLAERIAGAGLAAAGRRPVSIPLIDITTAAVLRERPGTYAGVAQHPSTVTALRDLHREIRAAGPAARGTADVSERWHEAARVSAAITDRLSGAWYDEADLLTDAIEIVRTDGAPFAAAVAFLPRPDRGLAADLLRAIGQAIDLEIVVDHSGVAELDDEYAGFAARLGAVLRTPPPGSAPRRAAVTSVSSTDADEEVRDATRRVVDAARSGVAFARITIVWPVDHPYARLVEHHLDAAGIPWNGRPGTLVTERLVPRFLLDLLDLDRRGLRRDDVFDFLADLPVRGPGGERVSVGRWERLARAAGVNRDAHWEPRLARLAAALRAREEPRERDAAAAEQLSDLIAGLRRDLGPWHRRRTWHEWAEWCERQVLVRLGRATLDQLDEAERLASDHANRVLDRLRHLDAVGAPVTRSGFRDAFAAEFEGAPGRLGRLGNGVTIGSLSGAVGLESDLTIVLGAAEGLLPPPPATDPLVADADRIAAGLPGADARARRSQRSLLAHLATSAAVVISAPRGDLRAAADREPSRWLAELTPDAVPYTVASHRAGLLGWRFPSTDAEHRLRGRATAAARDQLGDACAGDPVAVRGLAMRRARRSDRITVYDGDLTGIPIEHFGRPVSPSRIESWRACPHAYFARYLLGVHPLDDPTEDLALSPIERGNVIHETLDRFHRLVISGALPQPDTDGWTDVHRAELERLFDIVADEFESTGRTGRAAYWFLDRGRVRAELFEWFVRDGTTARARGARVVRSEWSFGYDTPVTLPSADGRTIPVAGYADRIDETATGDLVITDHKTGRSTRFRNISAVDPTEGATKFQLPVYAAAALAARGETPGATDVTVLAEYSFFDKGGYERPGYTFDVSVWRQVADDLQLVVDGIESGLYPNVTLPPQYFHTVPCDYCQPDGLGVAERFAEWSLKRADPRIVPWFPPDDGETAGGS